MMEDVMRRSALASVGVALWASFAALACVPAYAETANADPIPAYRAYEAAVSAGKYVEAADHAYQAWQRAEAKWGSSNPGTGGLAFNAAWSAALISKGTDRLDAARRAVELVNASNNAYRLEEAQFLLAYAQFLSYPVADRHKEFKPLADAALAVEGTWGDFLIAEALVQAARFSAGPGRGKTTVELAERALSALTRVDPNGSVNKAIALLARGQGRLFMRNDHEEAIADFIEARVVYGAMRRDDDPSWGNLAAWEIAARALLQTADGSRMTTGTRITRKTRRPFDLTDDQKRLIYGEQQFLCEGLEIKRVSGRPIFYPAGAARDNIVAGVIVHTDIKPDGSTQNVRLLGQVPAGQFGANAVAAVQNWKYEIPTGIDPKCLSDREVSVRFVLG
jgi:TonB family protein